MIIDTVIGRVIFNISEGKVSSVQLTDSLEVSFPNNYLPIGLPESINYVNPNVLTPFQLLVFGEVCHVKPGQTIFYSDLASKIGSGSRAVATALSRNPCPILIPCHRVVSKNDGIGGYIWGAIIKKKLLDYEKEGRGIIVKNI